MLRKYKTSIVIFGLLFQSATTLKCNTNTNPCQTLNTFVLPKETLPRTNILIWNFEGLKANEKKAAQKNMFKDREYLNNIVCIKWEHLEIYKNSKYRQSLDAVKLLVSQLSGDIV